MFGESILDFVLNYAVCLFILAVIMWSWRPQRERTPHMTHEPPPIGEPPKWARRKYELTLAQTDGRVLGKMIASGLPRHIHVATSGEHEGEAFLSDNPEPPDLSVHVVSFDRIGSAVHVDDDRDALFVRRV